MCYPQEQQVSRPHGIEEENRKASLRLLYTVYYTYDGGTLNIFRARNSAYQIPRVRIIRWVQLPKLA